MISRRLSSAVLLALLLLHQCPVLASGPVELSDSERRIAMSLSPLDPDARVDPTNRYASDPGAQAFGERLFFDTRLSADKSVSCATCHIPENGWAGGAIRGRPSQRTTPALWNVAHYRWYNWDGSADSLWAQSLGPIENPDELGASRVLVTRRILESPELRAQYRSVFGATPDALNEFRLPRSGRPVPANPNDPDHLVWTKLGSARQNAVNLVFTNLGKAIAAFEATLVSNNSPFDQFVSGLRDGDVHKLSALSEQAQQGLKLFIGKARCVLCHSGPTLSDSEFHNIFLEPDAGDNGRWTGINRLRNAEFNYNSEYNDANPGEAIDWVSYVVRRPETKRQFKTPSLRNIVRSAPFMHNGQFKTLEEVIEHYDQIETKIPPDDHSEEVLRSLFLSRKEKTALVAFLSSLTDESRLARLRYNNARVAQVNSSALSNGIMRYASDLRDTGMSEPGGSSP